VVAIYSTFLQRAYDQLIHDVAMQNLPVVFALDRAGLVGADGATHAGAYDIPFLRCIPNISMACPADENECRQLLSTAFEQTIPWRCVIRVARVPAWRCSQVWKPALWQGRGAPHGQGHCHAGLWHPAVPGAGGRRRHSTPPWSTCAGPSRWTWNCCCRWRRHEALVTVEEGALMGGAGSAVLEALHAAAAAPVATGPARRVHRARRSGQTAGPAGAGCGGHCKRRSIGLRLYWNQIARHSKPWRKPGLIALALALFVRMQMSCFKPLSFLQSPLLPVCQGKTPTSRRLNARDQRSLAIYCKQFH
jgi:hypothetical protein